MNVKKKPTIYDIAEITGVSIATVSRFLNSPLKVSKKTREKITEAIKELDYIPHADAAARARKDFKRIGILVPFFTAPSFVQRIKAVTETIVASEYELIIYAVETEEQLLSYLQMLPLGRRIDGLIIMALPVTDVDVNRIIDSGLTTVCLEVSHPKLSSVVIDNFEGGKTAADYLLKKGYERLAYIGEGGEPAYSLHPTRQRFAGYKDKLDKAGIKLPEDYVCLHPYGMDQSIKCAENLFRLNEPPDAVFCSSDFQAVGAFQAAKKLGLKIPEDIAILGFDNIDMSEYMDISTIDQGLDESGRIAAELLMEQLKEPERISRTINLRLELIERDTT
jgi:LacI family transcriptional regulator